MYIHVELHVIYIIFPFLFQCDIRFNGNTKYPTPSGRATDNKIGKGGNGFVFIMFHERKQYAVKKVFFKFCMSQSLAFLVVSADCISS